MRLFLNAQLWRVSPFQTQWHQYRTEPFKSAALWHVWFSQIHWQELESMLSLTAGLCQTWQSQTQSHKSERLPLKAAVLWRAWQSQIRSPELDLLFLLAAALWRASTSQIQCPKFTVMPFLAAALWRAWQFQIQSYTSKTTPLNAAALWPVWGSHFQSHKLDLLPLLAAARWRASPFPTYKHTLALTPLMAVEVCLSISESSGDVVEQKKGFRLAPLMISITKTQVPKNICLAVAWSCIWFLFVPWLGWLNGYHSRKTNHVPRLFSFCRQITGEFWRTLRGSDQVTRWSIGRSHFSFNSLVNIFSAHRFLLGNRLPSVPKEVFKIQNSFHFRIYTILKSLIVSFCVKQHKREVSYGFHDVNHGLFWRSRFQTWPNSIGHQIGARFDELAP